MQSFDDKTAVVTGAGGDIGRSIALALAREGANIVVADIQSDRAQSVADEIRALGVRALAVECDIARLDSVQALAQSVMGEFGRIDLLCNNAGVTWRPYRFLDEASLEDFDYIYRVNVWGLLHSLKTFIPMLKAQPGEKHIVNTGSLAGLIPIAGHSAYSSSKAAVISISEAIATELAPHGIGVTIFCPGIVPTGFQRNSTMLTARQLGEDTRQFSPVDSPQQQRFRTFALDSVDAVGKMVCDAIRRNALYLHTVPVPGDYLAERVGLQFPDPQASLRAAPGTAP